MPHMLSDTPSETWPPLQPHHVVPDVALIGAAKSATTALAAWIAEHPRIRLALEKEPDFFSYDEVFARGLDWYSDLFRDACDDQLLLDASTSYARWPQEPLAAERLAHYAPSAKLIYMLRHPVDRAYSHYVHRWSKECHPNEPFRVRFEEFVQTDPMCLDSSEYRTQIERYLEFYPRESLLCLFTSDFQSSPRAVLQQIADFLDLDDTSLFGAAPEESNASSSYLESRVRVQLTNRVKSVRGMQPLLRLAPRTVRESAYRWLRSSPWGGRHEQDFNPPPMDPATRVELLARYAPMIDWLESFTGRDLSDWRR